MTPRFVNLLARASLLRRQNLRAGPFYSLGLAIRRGALSERALLLPAR